MNMKNNGNAERDMVNISQLAASGGLALEFWKSNREIDKNRETLSRTLSLLKVLSDGFESTLSGGVKISRLAPFEIVQQMLRGVDNDQIGRFYERCNASITTLEKIINSSGRTKFPSKTDVDNLDNFLSDISRHYRRVAESSLRSRTTRRFR